MVVPGGAGARDGHCHSPQWRVGQAADCGSVRSESNPRKLISPLGICAMTIRGAVDVRKLPDTETGVWLRERKTLLEVNEI